MQVLVPLPIGFAVFVVHLATIPITGTGINPARSLGPAVIYNTKMGWRDHVSFFFLLGKSKKYCLVVVLLFSCQYMAGYFI